MSAFQWTSEHSVFVPSLDDQHKAMFQAMEELRQLMLDGKLTPAALAGLRNLVARTTRHLSHEEKEMRSSKYSGYEWHKRQHDTARKRIQQFSERAEKGESEAAAELLDFLKDWLRDHTGLHDRMMGAYLRNFHRSQEVS